MSEPASRHPYLARRAALASGVAHLLRLAARAGRGVAGLLSPPSRPPLSHRDRARAAYEAMQRYLHADHNLYRETYPPRSGRAYAYLWSFSQAMAGAIDLSGLSEPGACSWADVQDCLAGLARYWNAETNLPPAYDSYVRPPLGTGGDKYYDDNAWIGLELVRLYRMAGDPTVLSRARQVFDFIVSGWDTDPSHPAPGGVFWMQQTPAATNHDRNTVSNAPGAELGLRLYEVVRPESAYYLEWAKRLYDWTYQHLRDPSDGLYWDHVDLAGVIDKTKWSYNQGTMIGANVLLYRVLNRAGDPSATTYLVRAERTAEAALDYYGWHHRYRTQPAAFNAIFFKNLLLLAAETGDNRYRPMMQSYADYVWDTQRDPRTNLLTLDAPGCHRLLDQGAMVQVYAGLVLSESGVDDLPSTRVG